MLVAAVTAVAKVVTPTAVPTVVLIALIDQNIAIAMAATVLANSFRGAKRPFIIPLTPLSKGLQPLGCSDGLPSLAHSTYEWLALFPLASNFRFVPSADVATHRGVRH
jgi:hypothetical protein